MKLLFSLILIFTIAFNGAYSTKTFSPPSININSENESCFGSSFVGFTTSYITSCVNAFLPGNNGQAPEQHIFYETGLVSYDFHNQLFYNSFVENDINTNTTSYGYSWIFGKNNTEYYLPQDKAICYIVDQEATLPSKLPSLSPAGSSEIGVTPVSVISINDPEMSLYTSETILVTSDCTPMIYSVGNLIFGPDGNSLTNFFYYAPSPSQDYFQLPAICDDATPIESSKLSKTSRSILNKFK
ncbi:hypothetical protein DDB_G0290411 [Dictyostelium discoideum AX4]|uniref:Uncharacterized protein n=1 Tax=Dictyostelium discoideum TaxID=44689 RepID=Q54G46_DICDI|nr:hypothetical protein DDB_G0290411 [Dictyostelium discoideum AX4]EAL62221.1 hypothetical protein DDB_G0290411 [Dictyostelium discoideum AX4]|eukprot:XP_635726.1 hypothetical protein DDB_G0290411 [Dictyostelium discoideum AX4]